MNWFALPVLRRDHPRRFRTSPNRTQRVMTMLFRGFHAHWPNAREIPGALCIVLLSLLLLGDCTRPSVQAPVTLTFVDQEWATTTFNEEREREIQEFTRETGIQVKFLPAPESTREQLALWRELLVPDASGPDVYTLDVI